MRRLAAAALVFLTACSSTGAETTPSADTRVEGGAADSSTTSTPSLVEFGRTEIVQRIADIGPITGRDTARQVIEAVGLLDDPDLLPYAFDAGRFGGTDVLAETMDLIARVSGETAPEEDLAGQWWFYGTWLVNQAADPGPEYIPWKASLYAGIDPDFEPMLASIEDPVLAGQVQWGGVRRGGIPELNDAQTIAVDEADYMQDDEVVFGAVLNGQARAYPVRILGHHELANDTLGGVDVSLAYCTLCRTPVLYSGRLGDMVLDFETSGLLHNSNKIMVDNQTNSLWNQLTGEAFAGPLKGQRLTILPMTVTTWADWIAAHPDTDVQTVPALLTANDVSGLEPTGAYTYRPGDAYADYYSIAELWFPAFDVPNAFPLKAEVVTLDLDGSQLAVELEALLESGALVTELGGRTVVFVATGNGARVYEAVAGLEVVDGSVVFEGGAVTLGEDAIELPDGTRLPRVVSGQSFWFAWAGNHPTTDWWPQG